MGGENEKDESFSVEVNKNQFINVNPQNEYKSKYQYPNIFNSHPRGDAIEIKLTSYAA